MTCSTATGVRKEFGGLVAVNDVDFTIPEKSIVSLIGPNGAGKTTFFNMLTGVYKPTAGQIIFDGHDVTAKPPHAVTERGIGRTFQNIRLFHNMTALENTLVGMHSPALGRNRALACCGRPASSARKRRRASARGELLEFSGLRGRNDDFARNLSYGDQRRLEVARALATEPKLLLLDEPTAGMNPQETAGLHGLRVAAPRGAGADGAHDRARHAGRDGHLGPRDRPRLRREDRRGHAAGGAERRARDRGVPRARERWPDERARPKPILELKDVHTFYGSIEALKGISIEVARGRDRDADRRERRRQVDDAALDQRPQPSAPGHDPLPGQGHHRRALRTTSSRWASASRRRAAASSRA